MTETSPNSVQIRDSQWLYLAQFLELSPDERQLRGLPTTEDQLAEQFGTSSRNMRKWKANPAFQGIQARLAKTKKNPLRDLPLVNMDVTSLVAPQRATPETGLLDTVGPDDQEVSQEDQDLLASGMPDSDLEAHYRHQALTDPRAMKIYMDYWGKNKQLRALEESKVSLDELTLQELVADAVSALEPDFLVQYLARNGWKVERL